MFARADYLDFALNSIVISLGGTVLALLFAIPAAYSMAFHPDRADPRHSAMDAVHQDAAARRRAGADLPVVPVPPGLLDSRSGLVMIYALMNLPIIVWMLFTFYKEVPNEILEAGRMDGARTWGEALVPAAAADHAGRRLDRACCH